MRKKVSLVLSFVVVVLIVTLGISFAYFTAQFTGGETTDTITVTGGRMNITYDGGPNINIANIIPDNSPAAIKTFTITGNNNTEIPMGYKLSLVVEANDFSEEALKYKLNGTNTDNNGTVVPNIDMTDLGTGAKTIELGKATFDVPTEGNKTHSYRLEIYFPNQEYNQNIDQEKILKAHILIENYTPPKGPELREAILLQGVSEQEIESKGTPNFAQTSTAGETGLYVAEDEYGTSYYYRGEKTLLNNNLIWGGFQWKIVRINGDGSVRILYNGTCPNNDCTINSNGSTTQIGSSSWNTSYTDAKYLGYMFGGANGVASTKRHGSDSGAATYNETPTTIKTVLDNWYENNILNKSFVSDVVDNLFCNDRQLLSEVSGESTGTGYGTSITFYAPYYRLGLTKTPTLKCTIQNDRFTVNDTTVGNGNLTYPIGLLTAYEAAMAGLIHGPGSTYTNYLYTNQSWWLLSPCTNTIYAAMYHVNNAGYLYDENVSTNLGVRPVISIKGNVQVTGTGSAEDPYKVI